MALSLIIMLALSSRRRENPPGPVGRATRGLRLPGEVAKGLGHLQRTTGLASPRAEALAQAITRELFGPGTARGRAEPARRKGAAMTMES